MSKPKIGVIIINMETEQLEELVLTDTAPDVDSCETEQQFANVVVDLLRANYEFE